MKYYSSTVNGAEAFYRVHPETRFTEVFEPTNTWRDTIFVQARDLESTLGVNEMLGFKFDVKEISAEDLPLEAR